MNLNNKENYLFNKISNLKGVGNKISTYFKKKKIEMIKDLLWNFPYSSTDRSDFSNIENLEIGKIQTIKIKVKKYIFPRIRNLPNKIICENEKKKIELVYFNSREPFLKKIFKINADLIVSGKIGFYKNSYQIINPDYVTDPSKIDYIKKIIPKYSLTEGISEKVYRKIIEGVMSEMPEVSEWHDSKTIKDLNIPKWKEAIQFLHRPDGINSFNSRQYKRVAFDEIFSQLIILSNNRSKIKRIKKKPKIFNADIYHKIIKKLKYELTTDQIKSLEQINNDLKSNKKMFRILQGDVGCGKTIVSLIAAANVVKSKYQCGIMAPTDILAKQHYEEALKIFKDLDISVGYISGKLNLKEKIAIKEKILNGQIQILIGTHSLFYEGIKFKNLGFIIIDEQHKFGVKQRMALSKKGGDQCDVLLMSATPIPRTIMLTLYGDLDVSRIKQKPKNRKKILTFTKPEKKIIEIYKFVKKEIKNENQVFWVCPLINESKFLNFSSAQKRFEDIKKIFPNNVGLLHGLLDEKERNKILNDFQNEKIKIIISTTVIEVGVNFPKANLIIIENSEKFGLAQLHQLRGRVGRGSKQGICILLYKGEPSKNSIKRLKILKNNNDGFKIAEEDMNLRGHGDLIGLQQSGEKYFKIAKPEHHKDLFKYAEKKIREMDGITINLKKYEVLLKLFDKADMINIHEEIY